MGNFTATDVGTVAGTIGILAEKANTSTASATATATAAGITAVTMAATA
jgi:hypothetical protein